MSCRPTKTSSCSADHQIAVFDPILIGTDAVYRTDSHFRYMRVTRDQDHFVNDLMGALPTSFLLISRDWFSNTTSPDSPGAGQLPAETHSFADCNLSALAITETELKLMAAAAIIGFRSSPNAG
jgi:hypothetical protein